ncbi:MAG: hypothetical protein ACYTE5_02265 [Planctomycetota bacterium]|jgi:hypothetical protein
MILAKTRQYKEAGRKTDILTVDNYVDGVYLYWVGGAKALVGDSLILD